MADMFNTSFLKEKVEHTGDQDPQQSRAPIHFQVL